MEDSVKAICILAFATACGGGSAVDATGSAETGGAGAQPNVNVDEGGAKPLTGAGAGGRSNVTTGAGGSTSTGSGGSAANGGGGSSGGAGGSPDVIGMLDGGGTCAKNVTLPAAAPTLTTGTWVNISPASVPFNTYDSTGQPVAFSQGITLDPCNAGTLYVSVQANDSFPAGTGIYKTTTGGTSWQRIGDLDGPLHVKVDPRNPEHLYATDDVRGDHIGFWISKDGGQSWTEPDGFVTATTTTCNNHAYYIGVDPADFDHLLVSFHGSWCNNATTGFFESKDGGTTWIIHQPGGWMGGEGRAVFFLHSPELGLGNDQSWLCATQSSGHWVTTNGGASWKQATTINTDHGGNQLYYAASGALYAGGNPNLMRSLDNGRTWSPLAFGGFLSVIGDGVNLYTGTHGGGTFITAKESDDAHWSAYGSQTFAEGPFEMAFDSANGIVYSSNIRAGVWALKIRR